jgi:hypothetical protein
VCQLHREFFSMVTAGVVSAIAGSTSRASTISAAAVTSPCLDESGGGTLYCPSGSVITSGTATIGQEACSSSGSTSSVSFPSQCIGVAYCFVKFDCSSLPCQFGFTPPSGVMVRGGGSDPAVGQVKKILASIACCKSGAIALQACSAGVDGTGSDANFKNPGGIAISADGSFALVADFGFSRIRKITISSKSVTTLAYSSVSSPRGLAIDKTSSFAYVADTGNKLIRKIDLASGQGVTFAGGGTVLDGGTGANNVYVCVCAK